MLENQDNVALDGIKIMVYWWNSSFDIQGVHILKDHEKERFEYFPTKHHPFQEIILNRQYIYQINPSKNLVVELSNPHEDLKEDIILNLAEENYLWNKEGIENIAGHSAQRIAVISKASGKIIARYWIDKIHPVILRQERYDDNGFPLFASYYLEMHYPRKLSNLIFKVPQLGVKKNFPSPKELKGNQALKQVNFNPILPSLLPKGFALVGTYLIEFPHFQKLYLRYSDGIQNISIYENSRSKPYQHLKGTRMSVLKGHPIEYLETPQGKIIRFAAGKLTIALVGNVSKSIAYSMAGSMLKPISSAPFYRFKHYFNRGLQRLAEFCRKKN